MNKYKITITLGAIITLALLVYFFILLCQESPSKEVKKYYGSWELVNNNYNALDKYVSKDYKTLKTIKINRKNIENLTKNYKIYSCEFKIPKRDFAITTFNPKTEDCEKNDYLITTLDKLIKHNKNNNDWQDQIICFDLDNDMLIQRDCDTNIPDVGITYKKIK